jgi:ABC-type dipeptide/oligopeptide/nickel transport system ATPase subunit
MVIDIVFFVPKARSWMVAGDRQSKDPMVCLSLLANHFVSTCKFMCWRVVLPPRGSIIRKQQASQAKPSKQRSKKLLQKANQRRP